MKVIKMKKKQALTKSPLEEQDRGTPPHRATAGCGPSPRKARAQLAWGHGKVPGELVSELGLEG